MKKHIFLLGCWALGMTACQSRQNSSSEIPVINVRTTIQREDLISLKNDVQSIEYIPLETKDSCLISNLLNLQISKDFMFIYNGKTGKILQFDKKGKFIRQIAREGNGLGEYGLLSELALDNKKSELFIFQYSGPVLVYSFDGDYLRNDTTMKYAGGMYLFSDGKSALKGLTMKPVQQAPWAGALRDNTNTLVVTKSLYPGIVDKNALYMKELCFSPSPEGVLLFTPCNDTVFRINDFGIKPACILQRKNTQAYYDGIADINKRRDKTIENGETIGVYDFFESPSYIYMRLYKRDDIYIQRFNKKNGELKSCKVPDDYSKSSEAIPGNNVIGLENNIDGGVPFWPEYVGYNGTRAQVVNSYAISSLRNKGYLKDAPPELNLTEDSNPVIIIYTFKK